MTDIDELDAAQRAFDSAASKVGKSGYLAGNGGEKAYATAFHKLAQLNNQMTDRPQKIVLKRKYRKN